MTVSRISTYNIHQSTLNDASRVQSNLFELQKQISSGARADTFEGLNGQVELYANLNNTLSRTKQYLDNNKVIAGRLNTANATMDQLVQTATDLKNTVLLRRNATNKDSLGFADQLQGYWQTLSGQLNATFNGSYIFSGSATNTQAVKTDSFPQLAEDRVPDTNYYQGSDQDISVRIDDTLTMNTSIRADDPAFQKIFAALAMAKEGDTTDDDSLLAAAYDFLQEGVKEVINKQTVINARQIEINQTNDRLTSLQLYWQGVKDDVLNTDLISASTQVSINQGILQASFQSFARISALKLSDFLN